MMALIYGESGSSKTLIAMSMAMHIALGRPWCGRKVRQGFVVYLAPEGGSSVHLRYHAWCRHHGIDPSDDSVLFRTIPVTMDLCRSDADLKQIIANIKAAEAELGPCVLVIVDTVSRALAGGDENAPKDMGSFVLNCDRLREQTGATVLGVHHTPANGDNPRGHTSLKNGSGVRMRASKAATGLFKLKLDHLKDGAAGEELMLSCRPPSSAPTMMTRKSPAAWLSRAARKSRLLRCAPSSPTARSALSTPCARKVSPRRNGRSQPRSSTPSLLRAAPSTWTGPTAASVDRRAS
jgi:hypothetical protein